jgi:hypothetical protein
MASVLPSMTFAGQDYTSDFGFTITELSTIFPDAGLDAQKNYELVQNFIDEGRIPQVALPESEPVASYEKLLEDDGGIVYLDVYRDGSFKAYGAKPGSPVGNESILARNVYAGVGYNPGSSSTSGGVTTVTNLKVYLTSTLYSSSYYVNYKYPTSTLLTTITSVFNNSVVMNFAVDIQCNSSSVSIVRATQTSSAPAQARSTSSFIQYIRDNEGFVVGTINIGSDYLTVSISNGSVSVKAGL